MGPWWLYFLVFIFGYVTCKTFYFLQATRMTLKLVKSSRVIYLVMMAKAMEKYKIAEETMLLHLKEAAKDDEAINAFKLGIENERDQFKKTSVEWLTENTPPAFREPIRFVDWGEAMNYLLLNREEAYKFWRFNDDR